MLGGNEKKLLERNAALLKAIEKKIAAAEMAIQNPVLRDIDDADDIKKSSTVEARAHMGVAKLGKEEKARVLVSDLFDVPESRVEAEAGFLRYCLSKADATPFGIDPCSIVVEFCDENGQPTAAPPINDIDNVDPVNVKKIWGPLGGRKVVSSLFADREAFDAVAPVFEPFKDSDGNCNIMHFDNPAKFECWMIAAIDKVTSTKNGMPVVKIAAKTDAVATKLVDWFRKNKSRAQAATSKAVQSILALCRAKFDDVFPESIVDALALVFPADDEWPEEAAVYAPSLFEAEGIGGQFYNNASKMNGAPPRRHRWETTKKIVTGDIPIALFDDDLGDNVGA